MKQNLLILSVIILSNFIGCGESLMITSITSKDYLGYQPIDDPIPVSMVIVYDSSTNTEKSVYWRSLSNADSIRALLPNQSAEVSVMKNEVSGIVKFLDSSVSADAGSYEVVMDYMKYRVEYVYDDSGKILGSGRIGVGLRIKATVTTSKSNLNLASLGAIGLEANQGNLSGGISVDIIGIDSENITNLIPLTSGIDQTSIQSALQSLASIKSKLWEKDTRITPQLIAFKQAVARSESKILTQVSSYLKSSSSIFIRNYLMPDGENVNEANEIKLKEWMKTNGLNVGPGDMTMFLYGSEFEEIRKKAVFELKLNEQ